MGQIGMVAAAFLIGGVAPSLAVAQGYPRSSDASIRWTSTQSAAPLTISGVVIDVGSGEPVPSALVSVHDSIGVVADSGGRFVLQVSTAGDALLKVQRIGYETVTETILIREGEGVIAQVSVRGDPLRTCERMGCPDCPTAGVRVEVRDLRTGLAPTTPITLWVEAGGQSDSTSASFPGDNKYGRPIIFAGGVLEVEGPFAVEVRSSEHATWTASDLWLEYENCAWSPLLYAWLLPR